MDEPFGPLVAVKMGASAASICDVEFRGGRAEGLAECDDVRLHGGEVVHLGDRGEFAEVAAHVCGEFIHHDELAEQGVENRSEVLRFEGRCTLLGRVHEKEGAAVGRQLAHTINEERRTSGTEHITVFLSGRWREIALENGDVDAVRRHDGHRGMSHLPLEGTTVIVIGSDDRRTGEDGGIEVILRSSGRARCAGWRVGEVRETKVLRYCVCDIDIWRLAGLEVVVDGLDHGAEDAVGFR